MDNNKVYIAKLGKTVGLAGLLKVYIESDFPEQFFVGNSFLTNKKITLTIENYNHKNHSVKFKDINSIDDAKKLVNQLLYSSIEQTRETCNLNEKEFFWFDVMGCEIVDDSVNLGVVVEIHRYPSSDYLEITTNTDLVKEGLPKTFLIPYIDLYINKVEIENKTIYTKDCLPILENS